MNQVNLCGKIVRIKEQPKVTFITLAVRGREATEFVPVTIFQTKFFSQYFQERKWIGITGHLHISQADRNYQVEIIADDMFFVGDKEKVPTFADLPAEHISLDELGI